MVRKGRLGSPLAYDRWRAALVDIFFGRPLSGSHRIGGLSPSPGARGSYAHVQGICDIDGRALRPVGRSGVGVGELVGCELLRPDLELGPFWSHGGRRRTRTGLCGHGPRSPIFGRLAWTVTPLTLGGWFDNVKVAQGLCRNRLPRG